MGHFSELVALLGSDDAPLDRGAALVAAVVRPGHDPDATVARLDALAERTSARDVPGLAAELFGPGGFHGDRQHYHRPENSLLPDVLDRRLGIPLSLAVVGIEVGRRVGVDLVGVGMPGHFLLRDAADPGRFVDAFDGGAVIDRAACRTLFESLRGPGVVWDDRLLGPTPTAVVLVRMLNNLRNACAQVGDRAGLVRVLEVLCATPLGGVGERRQLAAVLAADGRFDAAAALHDRLVGEDPVHAEAHRHDAVRLRAAMN